MKIADAGMSGEDCVKILDEGHLNTPRGVLLDNAETPRKRPPVDQRFSEFPLHSHKDSFSPNEGRRTSFNAVLRKGHSECLAASLPGPIQQNDAEVDQRGIGMYGVPIFRDWEASTFWR